MAQDFGVSILSQTVKDFRGDHPSIMKSATVLQNAAATSGIDAGTVLGKITASGKLTPWSEDAVDGSQNPHSILAQDVALAELIAGDVKTVVYVHGEFLQSGLTFSATATDAEKTAAIETLDARGVYVK